jgi:hypothetical protein
MRISCLPTVSFKDPIDMALLAMLTEIQDTAPVKIAKTVIIVAIKPTILKEIIV